MILFLLSYFQAAKILISSDIAKFSSPFSLYYEKMFVSLQRTTHVLRCKNETINLIFGTMNKTNLVRYMLLLLVAVVVIPVKGQNLHAILFADTKDPSVGKCDLQDFNSLTIEVSTIASATQMELKKYFYKDEQCSNRNLRQVLDNLQTNKDDVIIFYYSGHGTRSEADVSEFPQMCLGSNDDRDYYPLENVLKQLNEQPARLKIVLGDCCNSYGYGVSPKNYKAKSKTVLSKSPVSVYCNLFKNNRGFLISTGSQKGETSSAMSNQDGTPIGGAFTICLLGTLQQFATSGMAATWEDVMSRTRNATYEWCNHTPIYAINIKEGTAEEAPVAAAPEPVYEEPQNTAQDNGSDDIEKITILTAIANENESIDTRVKVQDKALKALFNNPNVKVEVVASNGSTIVATERASDFVLRLCTAHNLVNLVEVDKIEDNQGRYAYLKVHEIYKK